MKILNLYAGIGGNRKAWGDDHEITSIENNEEIATIYQKYFPNDTMIVTDAHQYLLEHIREYDFIWSSPPCPTHSRLKIPNVFNKHGKSEIVYPDMKLYQELIILKHFSKKETKWVMENVNPYYSYLIKPQVILGRHVFWTNFYIRKKQFLNEEKEVINISGNEERYGFSVKEEVIKSVKKRTIIRNLVNPEISEYLFKQAMIGNKPLFNFNF